MFYVPNPVRLHVVRHAKLTNAKRILELTADNISMFDYTMSAKESWRYDEISELRFSTEDNTEFSFKISDGKQKIVMNCDERYVVLGFIFPVLEKGDRSQAEIFPVCKWKPVLKDFTEEQPYIVCPARFDRIDIGTATKDAVWGLELWRIKQIIMTSDSNEFSITDNAGKIRRYKSTKRDDLISSILATSLSKLGMSLETKTMTQEEFCTFLSSNSHSPVHEAIYVSEVIRFGNHPKKRTIAITNEFLIETTEDMQVTQHLRLANIRRLIRLGGTNNLVLELTEGTPIKYSCSARDTLLGVIMAVMEANSLVCAIGSEATSTIRRILGPPSKTVESKLTQRFLAATDKEQIMEIMMDFIANVSQASNAIKDKDVLTKLFRLASENVEDVSSGFLPMVLQCIQRILAARSAFESIAKGSKTAPMVWNDAISAVIPCLAHQDDGVCMFAALCLRSYIHHYGGAALGSIDKHAAINRSAVLEKHSVAQIINILNRTASDRGFALASQILLDLLEIVLVSDTQNTEDFLVTIIVRRLGTELSSKIWTLTRSSCPAIATSSSILACVVMLVCEDSVAARLAQSARESQILLWHWFISLSNGETVQRAVAAFLVQLLCDNDETNVACIKRTMPRSLQLALDGNGIPTGRPALVFNLPSCLSSIPISRIHRTRSQRNWETLFDILGTEVESAEVLWTQTSRMELLQALMTEFERFNQSGNDIWAGADFEVKFESLVDEIYIESYNLRILLQSASLNSTFSDAAEAQKIVRLLHLKLSDSLYVDGSWRLTVMCLQLLRKMMTIAPILTNVDDAARILRPLARIAPDVADHLPAGYYGCDVVRENIIALISDCMDRAESDPSLFYLCDCGLVTRLIAVAASCHLSTKTHDSGDSQNDDDDSNISNNKLGLLLGQKDVGHTAVEALRVVWLLLSSHGEALRPARERAWKQVGISENLTRLFWVLAYPSQPLQHVTLDTLSIVFDRFNSAIVCCALCNGGIPLLLHSARKEDVAGAVAIAKILKILMENQHELTGRNGKPIDAVVSLSGVLPEGMLVQLKHLSPPLFGELLFSDQRNPEIVWTLEMRTILWSHCHQYVDYYNNPYQLIAFHAMRPLVYEQTSCLLWVDVHDKGYYMCNLVKHPNWKLNADHLIQALLTHFKIQQNFDVKFTLISVLNNIVIQNRQAPPVASFPGCELLAGMLWEAVSNLDEDLHADNNNNDDDDEDLELLMTTTDATYTFTPRLYLLNLLHLVRLLSRSSAGNSHRLRATNCIPMLVDLIRPRVHGLISLGISSSSTSAAIVANSLGALAPMLSSAQSNAEDSHFLQGDCVIPVEDLLLCCCLDFIPTVMRSAIECVLAFADSEVQRVRLVQSGAVPVLLRVILRSQPSTSTFATGYPVAAAQGNGNAVSRMKSLQANRKASTILATKALAKISGVEFDDDLPPLPEIQQLFDAILSPYLMQKLRNSEEFIKLFLGDVRLPDCLWGEAERQELQVYLEDQIGHMLRTATTAMAGSAMEWNLTPRYHRHDALLQCAGIFVPIFNEQPNWTPKHKTQFLKLLLEFLNEKNSSNHEDTESIMDAIIVLLQNHSCVPELQQAGSLTTVVSLCSSSPLGSIQTRASAILLLACRDKDCVQRMGRDQLAPSVQRAAVKLWKNRETQVSMQLLQVLEAILCFGGDPVMQIQSDGGALTLLRIIVDPQAKSLAFQQRDGDVSCLSSKAEEWVQLQIAASKCLAAMGSDLVCGESVRVMLRALLPEQLANIAAPGPATSRVSRTPTSNSSSNWYMQNHDTPSTIWNDSRRSEMYQCLSETDIDKIANVDISALSHQLSYMEEERAKIGGVYVDAVLRNMGDIEIYDPTTFVSSCIVFIATFNKPLPLPHPSIASVLTAMCIVLSRQFASVDFVVLAGEPSVVTMIHRMSDVIKSLEEATTPLGSASTTPTTTATSPVNSQLLPLNMKECLECLLLLSQPDHLLPHLSSRETVHALCTVVGAAASEHKESATQVLFSVARRRPQCVFFIVELREAISALASMAAKSKLEAQKLLQIVLADPNFGSTARNIIGNSDLCDQLLGVCHQSISSDGEGNSSNSNDDNEITPPVTITMDQLQNVAATP